MTESTTDPGAVADAVLIAACSKGDEQAWRSLVERYRRLIHSTIVRAWRVPADQADEIFQRVVVKLFENIGKLRRTEHLPAWLVVVTRNECRKHARNARRWIALPEEEPIAPQRDLPDALAASATVERERRLALAFERLDGTSRALLSALYLEEPAPSYAEIARRLDRPVGSLGPTRARTLAKLRRNYLALDRDATGAGIARRALPLVEAVAG